MLPTAFATVQALKAKLITSFFKTPKSNWKMSSPQRQVGSRRLPPLPKVLPSTFLKVGKDESPGTAPPFSSPALMKMYGKVSYELANDFLEGPFRPALSPEAFAKVLSENKMPNETEENVDGKAFIIPGIINNIVLIVLLILNYARAIMKRFVC